MKCKVKQYIEYIEFTLLLGLPGTYASLPSFFSGLSQLETELFKQKNQTLETEISVMNQQAAHLK